MVGVLGVDGVVKGPSMVLPAPTEQYTNVSKGWFKSVSHPGSHWHVQDTVELPAAISGARSPCSPQGMGHWSTVACETLNEPKTSVGNTASGFLESIDATREAGVASAGEKSNRSRASYPRSPFLCDVSMSLKTMLSPAPTAVCAMRNRSVCCSSRNASRSSPWNVA